MTDINHVVLVGRTTREITERDFGYTSGGTARLNISLAVNESRKQQDGSWSDFPSFFDVTIWGKTAENLKPYLNKGRQIAVDGHLQQRRWEKDGQRFSNVVVIADNVELCGGRENTGGNNPQQAQQSAEASQQSFSGDGFPEDIPF